MGVQYCCQASPELAMVGVEVQSTAKYSSLVREDECRPTFKYPFKPFYARLFWTWGKMAIAVQRVARQTNTRNDIRETR